jgi:hypothetical protein
VEGESGDNPPAGDRSIALQNRTLQHDVDGLLCDLTARQSERRPDCHFLRHHLTAVSSRVDWIAWIIDAQLGDPDLGGDAGQRPVFLGTDAGDGE